MDPERHRQARSVSVSVACECVCVLFENAHALLDGCVPGMCMPMRSYLLKTVSSEHRIQLLYVCKKKEWACVCGQS